MRDPAVADRWTWLVVGAYTQLRLARGLVRQVRLPWQRPLEPHRMSPGRVRRGVSVPARAPARMRGCSTALAPGAGACAGEPEQASRSPLRGPEEEQAGATSRSGDKQAA